MAVYAIIRGLRNDEDVETKLARMRAAMNGRAERTSITESADAYQSERLDGLEAAMENDPEFAAAIAGANLGRRWDCMLEACHLCIPHDGEIVGIGEDFDGGDEPGKVHIRCQCVEVIVSLADEAEAAA